jgi:hypothetical protein
MELHVGFVVDKVPLKKLDFSLSIVISQLLHAHSSMARGMDEKPISCRNSTRTQPYPNMMINKTLLSSYNYVQCHADGHTTL